MNLEKMIHARIKEYFTADAHYRAFTGKDSMEEVTRDDIESFQLFRFRQIMRYASERSSFYKNLYAGIDEVASLNDIAEIPLTGADDLAETPYEMACIPLTEITRVFCHTTTGTTSGEPKKIFFTHSDADIIIESMEGVLRTVMDGTGVDECGSKVHILLPNHGAPLSIAGLIAQGVQRMQGTPEIGDCYVSTEEQIRAIETSRPHMIMGSAFRIWRITQEARHFHDLAGIGLKRIFITSEYLSIPMRRYMEEWWQAEVYHHYGMTEPGFVIGIECNQHDGFHFNESDLLFEVVDPITGKVLPEGQEGELVLTTLNRTAMPLIRYRTGDVARLIRTPCSCGASTLIRIGKLPLRHALIVKIGENEKIYSSLFDEALHQIPELVDYRIFISKENGQDVLECVAEIFGDTTGKEDLLMEQLLTIPPVRKSLDRNLLAPLHIRFTKRGELRRGGRTQKRRIKDTR
ncbi:MAG TPA: hypothetical protein PLM29_07560 [Deltaproteobacteria bacterium]|nr:hypothetical protein [Deltaproteobacteria bacterium]